MRSLIQCALYRGEEFYRRTIAVKKFKRGDATQQPNSDPESIPEREMSHLRLVDDALWFAANDAIRIRRRWQSASHPAKGTTRRSRTWQSKLNPGERTPSHEPGRRQTARRVDCFS